MLWGEKRVIGLDLRSERERSGYRNRQEEFLRVFHMFVSEGANPLFGLLRSLNTPRRGIPLKKSEAQEWNGSAKQAVTRTTFLESGGLPWHRP